MKKGRTFYLYWVTTADHDEDWFIVARTARSAANFHEDYEGYDRYDAKAEKIMSVPVNLKLKNGEPPCHAQLSDLAKLGSRSCLQTTSLSGPCG